MCSSGYLGVFILGFLTWSWCHSGCSHMSDVIGVNNFSIELPSHLCKGYRFGCWLFWVSSQKTELGMFPVPCMVFTPRPPQLCFVTGLPHTLLCARHFFSPNSVCGFTEDAVSLLNCVAHCHFLHYGAIVNLLFYGLFALQNL